MLNTHIQCTTTLITYRMSGSKTSPQINQFFFFWIPTSEANIKIVSISCWPGCNLALRKALFARHWNHLETSYNIETAPPLLCFMQHICTGQAISVFYFLVLLELTTFPKYDVKAPYKICNNNEPTKFAPKTSNHYLIIST